MLLEVLGIILENSGNVLDVWRRATYNYMWVVVAVRVSGVQDQSIRLTHPGCLLGGLRNGKGEV